jgi:hypothetical protein
VVTPRAASAHALGHPGDLLAWHGLSAVCMGVMLVAVLPGWFAGTATGVFAVGLAWCLVHLVRHGRPAAYLRLAVCCLAMLVMLRPGGEGHGSCSSARPPWRC